MMIMKKTEEIEASKHMLVMEKGKNIMSTNLSSPGLLPLTSGSTRVADRTLATTTASAI